MVAVYNRVKSEQIYGVGPWIFLLTSPFSMVAVCGWVNAALEKIHEAKTWILP
jgi:hypothetical protein